MRWRSSLENLSGQSASPGFLFRGSEEVRIENGEWRMENLLPRMNTNGHEWILGPGMEAVGRWVGGNWRLAEVVRAPHSYGRGRPRSRQDGPSLCYDRRLVELTRPLRQAVLTRVTLPSMLQLVVTRGTGRPLTLAVPTELAGRPVTRVGVTRPGRGG